MPQKCLILTLQDLQGQFVNTIMSSMTQNLLILCPHVLALLLHGLKIAATAPDITSPYKVGIRSRTLAVSLLIGEQDPFKNTLTAANFSLCFTGPGLGFVFMSKLNTGKGK